MLFLLGFYEVFSWQWQLFWYSVAVALLFVLRYMFPVLVGTRGEWRVNIRLSMLSRLKCFVLSDLLLNVNDKTVQIDHLVISNKAVFVIESKDMAGEIYGDNVCREFRQEIDGKTIMFPSPIKQNSGHIYGVKQLIKGISDVKLVSIVVFSDKATKIDVDAKIYVGHLRGVNKYIRHYTKGSLDRKKRVQIRQAIVSRNIKGAAAREKHIQEIKDRKREYVEKLMRMECPRCGGTITPREGKRGTFYGCTGFPNCKFNLDVSDYNAIVATARRYANLDTTPDDKA